jgi:hypothetical protein
MPTGYVFESGAQQAITVKSDGSNLPAPKIEKWKHVKTVDVNKPGWRAILDPEVFAAQGYQIWPEPEHFAISESALGVPVE